MRTSTKNLSLLPVLIAGFGFILTGHVMAQTFKTLHNFTAGSTNSSGVYTNSDGANPLAGLILSGHTLYGTAQWRGSSGNGTVFAVNTDGTGFRTVYSFTEAFPYVTNAFGTVVYTNSDGANPQAGLILSGNTLYGTAATGGSRPGGTWSGPGGTVFAVNTDGTGFTNLHDFTGRTETNSDGANPSCSLILSGNSLYGTAQYGGSTDDIGTVFKLNTDGTGFRTLHSFTHFANSGFGFATNSEGAFPMAGLIVSGNSLYGTAAYGGSSGGGTVFAINSDGTGFTNLHTCKFSNEPESGGRPLKEVAKLAHCSSTTVSAVAPGKAEIHFGIPVPTFPPLAAVFHQDPKDTFVFSLSAGHIR